MITKTALTQANEEKINQLEREKKALEVRNQQLEQELANSQNQLSESDKERKRQEIEDNKNLIRDKDKEKARLEGEQNQSQGNKNEPSGNKLNWAIGLGIVAIVISLGGIILFLGAKKKKKTVKYSYIHWNK